LFLIKRQGSATSPLNKFETSRAPVKNCIVYTYMVWIINLLIWWNGRVHSTESKLNVHTSVKWKTETSRGINFGYAAKMALQEIKI